MTKTRILLVDDDTLVRVGLKSLIDWAANGFFLVGEATDGLSALEMVDQTHPDIIITDAKMPRVSGIELIRELKNRNYPGHILVLSGYDDFDLVRQALKLGASDYILKHELNPDDLIRTLSLLPPISDTETQSLSSGDQNLKILRQNLLRDIVCSFYSREDKLASVMSELDIHLDSEPVFCFGIKISDGYRFDEADAEACQTLNYCVINVAEEIFGTDFNAYCFSGKTGEFYLLASPRNDRSSNVAVEQSVQAAKRFQFMLFEYVNLSCTIGIGFGSPTLVGIRTAYKQCCEVLSWRFYLEHNGIIVWNDHISHVLNNSFTLSPYRNSLRSALDQGNADAVTEVFASIRHDLQSNPPRRNAVCSAALGLLYHLQEYFESNGLSVHNILVNTCCDYQEIIQWENIQQMNKWLDSLENDLIQSMSQSQKNIQERTVNEVKKMIASHYAESLPLYQIAGHFHFSPAYLSSLLKKHTGMSYTEYLNNYRIKQAKILLRSTNDKIYKIGELVGFEDKYYFNKIFKQITGMTPGGYRSLRSGQ